MEIEARDALLIQLAQRCGGIEAMFDSVFSFLKRKTDFYHIQKEGDRIGFPEGISEKMVVAAYRKYVSDAAAPRPDERALAETATRLQGDRAAAPAAGAPPPGRPGKGEQGGQPKASTKQQKDGDSKGGESGSADVGAEAGKEVSKGVDGSASKKPTSSKERDGFNGFVAYNGGDCGVYRWSQTIDDVSMCIDLGGTYTSKQVSCDITRTRLKAGIKGQDALAEGSLPGEVLQEDATWSLEDRRWLLISMEKKKKTWWKSALEGGPEIDTQKVDSTCSIEDYDESTQAAISKVMFDEHQKRKGLPTSDELQQQELLKKAWDAEGSPFKGQPFDPSVLSVGATPPGGMPPGGMPPL